MAANTIRLGHEAVAHGAIAATLVDFPAAFNAKMIQQQYVPKEARLQQDPAFQAVPSWQHEEWDMGGDIYHDAFGYVLGAAFGTPAKTVIQTSTVFDSLFTPANDPWSLSLQWQQTIEYIQALQALYGVLDELTVEFGADKELTWTAKGFAMPESTLSVMTPTVATTKPLVNWQGQIAFNNLAVPGAASVASGATGLPDGIYKCVVTFVTALGETSGGTSATVTVSTQKVEWTAIPLGPAGTTARKLYRSVAGGTAQAAKLVTTLADNTTAVYSDNVADGALGATVPQWNTSAAFADLVSAKITWKRNRAPFFTINNTQSPRRMRKGMRMGTVEFVVDPINAAGFALYTAAKAGTAQAAQCLFIDAGTTLGTASNPTFMLAIPNFVYKTQEIDVGGDTPLVKLNADTTLYSVSAGYQMAATLRSTTDWSIA